MNLKKKELIITIIMLVVFIVIGLNLTVFAAQDGTNTTSYLTTWGSNTSNNSTGNIQAINTNTTSNTSNTNTNTNTNTTKMPNTGAEDLPWLVIAGCVVSAVFAYNKIKEYKEF